jgi:hypothetical protein
MENNKYTLEYIIKELAILQIHLMLYLDSKEHDNISEYFDKIRNFLINLR